MTTATPAQKVEVLTAELANVKAEISSYPRPIAGCDAQFNYLLERRDMLFAALSSAQKSERDQTDPGI